MISRRSAALATRKTHAEEESRIRRGLLCSQVHAHVPEAQLESLAEICHSLSQYLVYENAAQTPTGFLSWAWISDFTLNRLNQNVFAQLHPSEWNEGTILCFRDLAVTAESAEAIATDLGGGLFPDEPCYITMQAGAEGKHALIRFEPHGRYELAEWIRGLYVDGNAA